MGAVHALQKSEFLPDDTDMAECAICSGKFHTVPTRITICGLDQCKDKACPACTSIYYGSVRRGNIISSRSLSCPFCRQATDRQILAHVDHKLCAILSKKMEENYHYGWCKTCGTLSEPFKITCGQSGDTIKYEDYECEQCVPVVIKKMTKPCPGCQMDVSKIDGCNYIECPCGAHWCYFCGYRAVSETQVMRHMRDEHGGYFVDVDYNYMIDDKMIHDSYPPSDEEVCDYESTDGDSYDDYGDP